MGNVTTMTVFVWTVNVLIFLSQIAMVTINPAMADGNQFYSVDNTVLDQYTADGSNITMPDESAIADQLDVTDNTGVQEVGGLLGIIDAVAGVAQWFNGIIEYFTALVMGPYNILSSIGLPAQFVGPIVLVWYGTSILLLVLTIFGRQH